MSTRPDLEMPKEKIADFCKKNHIRKLSIFGSALSDTFTMESDVDMLVEFDSDHIPGFITLAGMEIELSKILGRKADLRTEQELSPYFRQEIIESAVIQYTEG